MHLDWQWIKQRPHFFAEGLSDFFDIKVLYMVSKQFMFKNYRSVNEKNLDLSRVFRIPFHENKLIYNLNTFYLRIYLKLLIERYKPDFLWITFPQLYDFIPSNIQCKIIYDCMDLATAFDFNNNFKHKVIENEKKLINDSSVILVSSYSLYLELKEKYNCEDKLVLIRNAFGGEIVEDKSNVDLVNNEKQNFKIGFIGNISNKLVDFDSIEITLNKIENIEYHFIGPVTDVQFKHDRVKFYGIVNYHEIKNYVKNFDCFILPFKLDEFRRASDPVKVYEYINYNKPIVSVYYEELDYFSQFLYFYSNNDDLVSLIKTLVSNGFVSKYSDRQRVDFLLKNSWEVRIFEIKRLLFSLK